MKTIALIAYLFPLIVWGFQLDTIQGNLLIKHGHEQLFEIPILSINCEEPKSDISIKLGSVDLDVREVNSFKPTVTYFSSTAVSLSDGDNQITFVIDQKGKTTIESTSGHVHFSFKNVSSENFYGGGVQFTHPKLNGHRFVNICEENGIGRGDSPISKWTRMIGVRGESYSSYYPIPFVLSDKHRGFSIQSNSLSIFNFTAEQTNIYIAGNKTVFQLYYDEDMLNMIREFNATNGRGNTVPKWALGSIIGVQGGTKEVEDKIAPLIDLNLPIKGIWIQDWVGKRETKIGSRLNWVWQLNSSYAGIFDFAANHDLKVLGYINPFFAETGKYTTKGLDRNYFLGHNGEAIEFDFGGMSGYMLDIHNQDAFDWMKSIIKTNLVDNGFDGWMADFAEWYPVDALSEIESHNSYASEWVRLNHEIQTETDKDLFIFHRSGNVGTAKFTQGTWCGDQMTNYGLNDGLPSAINAMISSGFSGLPPLHSDIGGYTSVNKFFLKKILPSEDLLKDWITLEAFTPFLRSHEGLLPDKDLQIYSPEIIEHYAALTRVHDQLTDYFYDLIKNYQNNGTPIFRHPVLLKELDIPYSFFVGNDIYIQFTEKVPHLPKGFKFFNNDRKKGKVHISYRENSSVAQRIFP